MRTFFFSDRISAKLYKIIGVSCLIFLTIVGIILSNYHASMMQDRKERAEKLVSNAINLVNYYYEKAGKGELELEQAKHYALDSIRNISTHSENYYWVIDTNARIIMHPIQADIENRDMSDYVGPDDQKLFLEMVRIATTDESGFIKYIWAKPEENDARLYPKISYIRQFKPWGWIIGSGVYVEDVNQAFWNAIYVSCGVSVAILMFVMALGVSVSESMKKAKRP